MIVATVTTNAALAGVLALIPALAVSYFGYKKAVKVDTLAAQAGMATTATISTGQVMTSLNDIIERYAEDNVGLRERLDKVMATLEEVRGKLDQKDELIGELRAEVAAYMRRNGITGDPDLSKSDTDLP